MAGAIARKRKRRRRGWRGGMMRLLRQARRLSVAPIRSIGKSKQKKRKPRRLRSRIAPTPAPENRILDERAGSLQARLAETWDEIDAALALRYSIFFDAMK